MAELGPIPYTNETSGRREVDYRAELEGAANLLSTGKQVLDEGIKAKVTGDMLDAIAESDVVEQGQEDTPIELKFGGDSTEAYLARQIDRLTAKARQGNSNQRANAELRIKSIMNQAQEKYPWLYEDLQRRAGAIISGNAQLEVLGMEDAAAQTGAELAEKQLQDMYDKGVKRVSEGGYGLDPALQFGSPQWQYEYAEQAKKFRDQQQIEMDLALELSKAQQYFLTGGAEIIRGKIADKYSYVNTMLDLYADSSGFTWVRQELSKGGKADLEAVDAWINGEDGLKFKQSLIAFAEDMRVAKDRDVFTNPYWKQTDIGKDLSNDYDKIVEYINNMASAMDTGDIDVIRQAEMTVRASQHRLRGRLDEYERDMYFMLTDPVFDSVIKAGQAGLFPNGIDMFNWISKKSPGLLQTMAPSIVGPAITWEQGALLLSDIKANTIQVPPNARPEDVNEAITQSLHDNPARAFQATTSTGRQKAEAAFSAYSVVDQHFKELLNKTNDKNVGVTVATDTVAGLNYALKGLSLSGGSNFAQLNEPIVRQLASEELGFALKNGDRLHTQAFALTAEEFYAKTNPEGRKQAMRAEYTQTREMGVTLSQAISISVDGLLKGELTWVYDDDAIERMATYNAASGARMRAPNREDRRKAKSKLEEYTYRWQQEMERQMGVQKNLNYARSADPNKPQERDELIQYYYDNFRDVFTPVG